MWLIRGRESPDSHHQQGILGKEYAHCFDGEFNSAMEVVKLPASGSLHGRYTGGLRRKDPEACKLWLQFMVKTNNSELQRMVIALKWNASTVVFLTIKLSCWPVVCWYWTLKFILQHLQVISGHLGWVRCIAVEPGNQWFVTGSADRTIKVMSFKEVMNCCSELLCRLLSLYLLSMIVHYILLPGLSFCSVKLWVVPKPELALKFEFSELLFLGRNSYCIYIRFLYGWFQLNW